MQEREGGPASAPTPSPKPTSPTPDSISTTSVVDAARQHAEQLHRRRDAASRCEPFECGHRDPLDCDAAGCSEQRSPEDRGSDPEPAVGEPGDFAQLWADAKVSFLAKDFPKYGSQAWQTLHPDDPKRFASALHAAECWRRYGDEEELVEWLKNLGRRPNLVDTRSRAELDLLAKPKPPHQLRATPCWPPIAVPGQPGKYLTYRVQKAA